MYFATAYTKTDTDMFEMESAAESGRLGYLMSHYLRVNN